MSHNAKYYFKSLKRNKLKSSDIRGLWNKKNLEENTVSIHWQILQLLILPVSVRQVSQKKRQCYRSRQSVFFSLYYIVQFNIGFLKFVLVKWKFPWIVSFKAMISWFCLPVAHASIFDPLRQTFWLENQHMKPFFSFLLQSSYLKEIFLPLSFWFFLYQLSSFIY